MRRIARSLGSWLCGLLTVLMVACAQGDTGSRPVVWEQFGQQGLIERFFTQDPVETVAWRWRDFFPDDTGKDPGLWVVKAFGWSYPDGDSVPALVPIEGRISTIALADAGDAAAGSVLSANDYDLHVLLSEYTRENAEARMAGTLDPDARQIFAETHWPRDGRSLLNNLEDEAYNEQLDAWVADGSYEYTEQLCEANERDESGEVLRAWKHPYGETSSAITQSVYLGGVGTGYKFCAVTGEEVLASTDGSVSYCLPDCQLVLKADPGSGFLGTPQEAFLQDAEGEPLIPVCSNAELTFPGATPESWDEGWGH